MNNTTPLLPRHTETARKDLYFGATGNSLGSIGGIVVGAVVGVRTGKWMEYPLFCFGFTGVFGLNALKDWYSIYRERVRIKTQKNLIETQSSAQMNNIQEKETIQSQLETKTQEVETLQRKLEEKESRVKSQKTEITTLKATAADKARSLSAANLKLGGLNIALEKKENDLNVKTQEFNLANSKLDSEKWVKEDALRQKEETEKKYTEAQTHLDQLQKTLKKEQTNKTETIELFEDLAEVLEEIIYCFQKKEFYKIESISIEKSRLKKHPLCFFIEAINGIIAQFNEHFTTEITSTSTSCASSRDSTPASTPFTSPKKRVKRVSFSLDSTPDIGQKKLDKTLASIN